MHHLTATEPQGHLGLVALGQETRQITQFDLVIRLPRFIALAIRQPSTPLRPRLSSSTRSRSANVSGTIVPRSLPLRERTDNRLAATSLSPATRRYGTRRSV